jgi:RecA DNA recombination protein
MSSLLVCAQPATGQPASFVPLSGPALLERLSSATHASRITPASRLEVRPVPELVSTGISQIDALTSGLPRGCLTEIYGQPSSGRTSILLSVIAAASQRKEACALVDVSDALDPHSAADSGADLRQLLWVRCRAGKRQPSFDPAQDRRRHRDTEKASSKSDMTRMAQALKVTDLLVQSGGFGLIAIDLGDLPHGTSRRIPLASWFRFRRAVENTPTVLLVISQAPCARTCASLLLRLEKSSVLSRASSQLSAISPQLDGLRNCNQEITVHNFPNHKKLAAGAAPAHARLLEGISIYMELERSRLDRKPPQSDRCFQTSTRWCAGNQRTAPGRKPLIAQLLAAPQKPCPDTENFMNPLQH